MPTAITRNLHLFFSKIKIPSFSSSSSLSSSSSSAPLDRTLQNPDSVPSSSYSSSSTIFFKNFNSVYDPTAVSTSPDTETPTGDATSNWPKPATAATGTAASTPAAADPDDPATAATPPFSPACIADLSSAMASRRLLRPSSPGRSNAIADPAAIPVGAGVAVPTYSTDPYGDFRRSMEQMAAEMGLLDQYYCSRRERLLELLLCYLVLNRKHAHKYIVGAFADLLVAPVEPAPAAAAETPDVEEEEAKGGQ